MGARFVAALERPVSRVRLETYHTPGISDDLEMVANYFFNVELSEALYPALQAFEVALRNSLDPYDSPRYLTLVRSCGLSPHPPTARRRRGGGPAE